MQTEVEEKTEKEESLTALTLPWENPRVIFRYRLRRALDWVLIGATTLAVGLVLYPLLNILSTFFYKGALAISIPRLTQLTYQNGLANAISGTLLLTLISASAAIPLGVLGGVYLAEFTGPGRLSNYYSGLVRFVNDILAGVPSILLGYVGFLILVVKFGWGFSPLAGGLVLAVLMLPYIVKTTELSLRKVPSSLRESAMSLGATKTQLVNRLSLPLAAPGILTGILIAMSISVGETAALIYTAGSSDYNPCGLINCRVNFLTSVVYNSAQVSSPDSQNLAYLATFILITIVIALNLIARVGLRRLSKV